MKKTKQTKVVIKKEKKRKRKLRNFIVNLSYTLPGGEVKDFEGNQEKKNMLSAILTTLREAKQESPDIKSRKLLQFTLNVVLPDAEDIEDGEEPEDISHLAVDITPKKKKK